jgi:phthalate 4,5-dioxygenase oxygenase subunit
MQREAKIARNKARKSAEGIPAQDIAMWESMGGVVDRATDYLGASDLAVAQFRRQMVAAAKRMREGGPAIDTTGPRIPQVKLASFEGVVQKKTDWRTLAMSEHEHSLATRAEVPGA